MKNKIKDVLVTTAIATATALFAGVVQGFALKTGGALYDRLFNQKAESKKTDRQFSVVEKRSLN